MKKKKTHSMLIYRPLRFIAKLYTRRNFKTVTLRNEIRDAEGPYVVIANHQCATDFMYMLAVKTKTPVSLVISDAFYRTCPVKKQMDKVGVIPKQQFQTLPGDVKRMKKVISDGGALVIYPAGLMCEDGVSTPIPDGTYKFLKWLKADIYVARISGSYFVKPKWSKKTRPGKTFLDIYKLYDKEKLAADDVDRVKERVSEALAFDAYREQEKNMVKYAGGDDIEGLEHVLYACPNCGAEYSVHVKDRNVIACSECGYTESCDEYGFLRLVGDVGKEIRYVSDWNACILEHLKEEIAADPNYSLSEHAAVQVIDDKKCKFVDAGEATLSLNRERIALDGVIGGEHVRIEVPTDSFASLPFVPGERLELQNGNDIYRLILDDGKKVMKLVNAVKLFYLLARQEKSE